MPSPQVNTWEESPGDVAMSAELPSASGVMDLLDNVVNSASSNQGECLPCKLGLT